jgi:peptide/nickel transport system substrate-binding protein
MRWQVLIAVLAIVGTLVLAGLGAYRTTTVLVPDAGGTYREAVAGSPRYINPLLSAFNDVDRDLVALVFEGLTVADDKGQIQPLLAQRWEVSADNLSYTFHLRQDVLWQDGVPFTADDVVFTVDLLHSPDLNGPHNLAELWSTVKVERPDAYTVVFILDEPFAPFLHYTTLGLLPVHLLKDVAAAELSSHPFNLQPVGTGPFRVVEVTPEHALLAPSENYRGGRPYLDRIELVFYPDYASVYGAYADGEVEGISHVASSNLSEVSADNDLNLFCSPLAGYGLVFLNLERPVFQQKEVRQALLLATDRQRLISHVLDNQAIKADGPVLPTSWAFAETARRFGYDPAAAIALLEKAGWIDSDQDGVREKGDLELEFALLTNDDDTRIQIINELTRQWAEVGVRAIPQTAGVAGVVRDFLQPHSYDAIVYEWQWLPTDPDPYPQWHSTQRQGGGQNYTGYGNEAADLLMEAARQTTDDTQRASLYRQLWEILAEDVPVIPLYHPVHCYAVDKLVHDVRVGPLHDYPDRFRTITDWYINQRRVLVSEQPLWNGR